MPNGKHGHGGRSTTPFWKRLLALAVKVAVIIAAASLALEYTWAVILAAGLGVVGYAIIQFVSETPVTKHAYSELITLLSAVGVVVGLQALGTPRGAVIILGLVAYATFRFLAAWVGRIRYWYSRGTQGRKTWKCPNCRSRRYRVGGDFIPHCYQCDWRPGFPVLRWVRYSVFAQQARRTLRRARLRLFLVSIITITVIIALTIGTGFGLPLGLSHDGGPIPGDTQIPGVGGDGNGPTPPQSESQGGTDAPSETPPPTVAASDTDTPQQTQTPAATSQRGYNLAEVEAHFIEVWNAERESRGLQPVSQRDDLRKMGESHSAVMAREGEIGHVEPDGSTIEDRYRDRNLLPECRLNIPSSNQYYPGAENAAQTWVDRQVRESGETKYIGSEEDLAEMVFEMWMNSPPHRRPMLLPATDEAGLGLNITSNGAVYASLEMC